MAREKTQEKSRTGARASAGKRVATHEGTSPSRGTARHRASPATPEPRGAAPDVPSESNNSPDAPDVGSALRQLRGERGLSLDKLAYESGVSRAMLSQIELGRSTPTITVLWRIARALGVPFSSLLGGPAPEEPLVFRASRAKVLKSADGSFSTRALFPLDRPHTAEFYELRLAPRGVEMADAHAPGTTENIVVTAGALEINLGGTTIDLRVGDATHFQADVPHEYRNSTGHETVAYLVMTYTHRT
jgi:transcriptional regulator with XRE-family HTH domain